MCVRTGQVLLLGFVLGGCAGHHADELGEREDAIIAGQPTDGYPSAVFLSMECTGTVISPRVVLTAKHCTEGSTAASVQAYVTNQAYEGSPIQVTKIAEHAQADISLLALQSPAPVMPMPVFGGVQGSLEEHIGESVTYVGFGASNNDAPPNDGYGPKRAGASPLDHLEGDSLLTGYDMNASWHCFGDSGGPAFMTMNGVEQLAGVISSGAADQCGVPGDVSVRTDAYYGWIMGFTVAEDGPPACNHDGRCQDECAAEDPDCSGAATQPPPLECAADASCNSACGDSDPDCAPTPPETVEHCVRDGLCESGCGVADPDCPSKPKSNAPVVLGDDDSASTGSCQIGMRGDSGVGSSLLLVALGAIAARRRRARKHEKLRTGA